MHVNHLSITPFAAHNSRHDDKLVLEHEVAYASLTLSSDNIELEGGRDLHKKEEKKREGRPHRQSRRPHCETGIVVVAD